MAKKLTLEECEYVTAWAHLLELDQVYAKAKTCEEQRAGVGRYHKARLNQLRARVTTLKNKLTPVSKASAIYWQRIAIAEARRQLDSRKYISIVWLAESVRKRSGNKKLSDLTIKRFFRKIGWRKLIRTCGNGKVYV